MFIKVLDRRIEQLNYLFNLIANYCSSVLFELNFEEKYRNIYFNRISQHFYTFFHMIYKDCQIIQRLKSLTRMLSHISHVKLLLKFNVRKDLK
jgi:hypothetical protein